MKQILVFFGGQSPEHDISCITGVMTVNSVDKKKFSAIPVYVSHDGLWFTGNELLDISSFKNLNYKKLKRVCITGGDNVLYEIKKNKLKKLQSISCAINCMHGAKGEDGALKGLLDMSGIPIVGSDLLPASLSMDKGSTKIFLKGLGIKTLPYALYDESVSLEETVKKLSFPIMVKPCKLGSSIGINKVFNMTELEKSIEKALKFDDKILLEKCASSKLEINCGAYMSKTGVTVSECEMPSTKNKFLTFEDKYVGGGRVFPAPISQKLSDKIKAITKKIYLALGFSGVIRVDFLIDNGIPYVNEINSVPGSLAYYLFTPTFKEFSLVLTEMISLAMEKFNKDSTLITNFSCDILNFTGGKGGKRFDN